MHDMAITTNYSIFFDFPIVFDMKRILHKDGLYFDKQHGSRIGIIPRHATDPNSIRWFTVSTCYMFHTVNAWEDGDIVVITGARLESLNLNSLGGGWIDPNYDYENDTYMAQLYEWRINIKTGEVEEELILANIFVEFPQINPSLIGVKNQFCYCPFITQVGNIENGFAGVLKFDLNSRKVCGMINFPRNGKGGEAVFVERENAQSEDHGYLLTLVYYEQSNTSQFVVMDAKTMSNKFIATVDLPQRVPYGFHGLWVGENDLLSQE